MMSAMSVTAASVYFTGYQKKKKKDKKTEKNGRNVVFAHKESDSNHIPSTSSAS